MNTRRHLRGGVQPPSHKAVSTRTPIQALPLPAMLVLPLGDNELLHPSGTWVGKGELIASGRGLPVHASTSGHLRGVEQRTIDADCRGPCVLLEPDGEERWREPPRPLPLAVLDREQMLAAVQAAGIAGLGGGGFPTAIKLAASGIHTLVINAMECEPYVTADDALLREAATDVVAGIRLAARILETPRRILIGIEDDKPEALAALRDALDADDRDEIEIVVLPARYPAGAERQLIALLTGVEIPGDDLPIARGLVCLNVATAHALQRALGRGEPLLERIVTVSGAACRTPANYRVLLGSPVSHLLAASGYAPANGSGVLLGGRMMGRPLHDLQTPVTRTTHCVLALLADELQPLPLRACIRCGWCADACPVGLLPQQLHRHALAGQPGELVRHHLDQCLECGACDHVCPSAIPLARQFAAAKAQLAQLRADRQRADRDRDRFAAHKQRLMRESAERETRRATLGKAAPARDLATLAMARATGASPVREPLERAIASATERLQRLENQLAGLDASATPAQRNALRARIEQARIDHEQAQRRLASAPAADSEKNS